MWFFGLLLLAAAGGLTWGHRQQQRKLGLIATTPVVTVAHLRELAASMAAGLGEGSLHFVAAVRGKVRSDAPLTSELAGRESVYYAMSVRRELESTGRDAKAGSPGQVKHSDSQQLAHEKRSVAFTVEDATGSIRVDPAGASFTAEKALSRFEPAAAGPQTLSVGSFRRELPSLAAGESTTTGYRFEEEVIAVGREVFVLGEVTDPGGELEIGDPAGGGQFLISVKDRDQILQETGSQSKFMRGAAIVFAVLGLILLFV